ncbi:Chitinase A1 [Trametes pubescens]|uniref:Chitinase A1 n=1 Tax=Trametes pubescens TaxID=154538 RepID=A0A1M2V4U1_TRAPU|nr:Chitinase A1 [Trametes pubescens]
MLSFLFLALSIAIPFTEAKPHSRLRRTCPSKSSGSSNSSSSSTSQTSRVAAGWYAGYHSTDFPLSDVSWSKYTHLTYSFATTTPDVNEVSLDDSDGSLLPQFVDTAHKNNVKALVSIGGWTGSKFFSNHVATAANRTAFVKTVTELATKYNLDGIDFEYIGANTTRSWEYPGSKSGLECNSVASDDTANFLTFLQELRADPVGKNLVLSAATSITPWVDANATPSKDISGFAKVLDWVAIMNYDIWGSWSTGVGPNAPLNDTCAAPAQQQGSAVSAVKAWSDAGMPMNQIVLGVAAYGHSFHVDKATALTANTLNVYPAFVATQQPAGDKWDGPAGSDDGCGVLTTQPGGIMDFWGLIDAKFLNANGTAAPGINYRFDDCSQTVRRPASAIIQAGVLTMTSHCQPFVYNEATQVMVSFDDAHSFASKGDFIKSQNLRGFSMWEAGGDSADILLNSIRTAVGF